VLPFIEISTELRAQEIAFASDDLNDTSYAAHEEGQEDAVEEYLATQADSSEDEGPADEFQFSLLEKIIFRTVYQRDMSTHEFRDLSGAELAVVREEDMYDMEAIVVPRPQTAEEEKINPRAKPLIYPGLMFSSMLDMKIWMQEYAVRHYRPFIVHKSDKSKRFVLWCENREQQGCPWKVCARPTNQDGR
jgi:hypothetical protein